MKTGSTYFRPLLAGFALVLSLGVFYWVSLSNYLLFHALAELFSVLVAGAIFILTWNTRFVSKNGYLLFLGIAFLFIGFIDLLHTLAYKGMGVFPNSGADLPTQLWISARYLQAFSLLLAPIFLSRAVRPRIVFAGYAVATGLLLLSIFSWRIFPSAYQEGVGLTQFKVISEYIISLILLASLIILYYLRSQFAPEVTTLLITAIGISIASEIAFTGYVNVFDLANMLGHLGKIAAYYFIYKAIVETALVRPYNLLFRELKQSEAELRTARDELEDRVRQRTLELDRAVKALQQEVGEHQQTESELREYREHLEELVEARTRELQKAEAQAKTYADQLERSNKDLQDFAFIASHDLQEPLRKIRMFGDRLKQRDNGEPQGDQALFVERMQAAAERMQHMIDDLLAYSRVTTRPQAWENVDLNVVVGEVLQDLEASVEQSGGKVEVGPLPKVRASPLQVRQLVQNLLGNALKFHRPDQPPQVKIFMLPPGGCLNLDSAAVPAAGMATIAVEDNGIGFDAKYIDRIFQPFMRLVGRSEYEGSGMGLAICAKIVERNGGKLTAESQPGQGARFIFSLPLAEDGHLEPGQPG